MTWRFWFLGTAKDGCPLTPVDPLPWKSCLYLGDDATREPWDLTASGSETSAIPTPQCTDRDVEAQRRAGPSQTDWAGPDRVSHQILRASRSLPIQWDNQHAQVTIRRTYCRKYMAFHGSTVVVVPVPLKTHLEGNAEFTDLNQQHTFPRDPWAQTQPDTPNQSW